MYVNFTFLCFCCVVDAQKKSLPVSKAMSTFDKQKANLYQAVENLQSFSIRFLCFDEKMNPTIRTSLKKLTLSTRQVYYLCHGIQPAYVYAYASSELKYIVEGPPELGNAANVQIVVGSKDGDTYHGDHVTFGIIRKKPDKTIIKTHKTFYNDPDGNLVFDTQPDVCNFTYNKNRSNLSETQCEKANGDFLLTTLRLVYSDSDISLIEHLVSCLDTGIFMNGDEKRFRSRKTKIQTGGMYKNISFLTDTFIAFMIAKIIRPVSVIRKQDFVWARVFFDENCELLRNGNKHIVFVYEFEEDRIQFFYIDSIMMLTACYADIEIKAGRRSNLEPTEEHALFRLEQTVSVALRQITATA
jgi:hypothetical protein